MAVSLHACSSLLLGSHSMHLVLVCSAECECVCVCVCVWQCECIGAYVCTYVCEHLHVVRVCMSVHFYCSYSLN